MASSSYRPERRLPLHSEPSFNATETLHERTPTSASSAPETLQNAVLDSMHTSTTESILQWSHFDVFPSLRQMYVSIFTLEQSRAPVHMRQSTMIPYASSTDIDKIVSIFEHTINFWYPTVSQSKLKDTRSQMSSGQVDDSTSSCLAFLIMALGCASQATSGMSNSVNLSDEEMDYRASRKSMADMYFDGLLKKLHIVHMEMSATAVQCLFLVA